jgi:CHC2 zinc finger
MSIPANLIAQAHSVSIENVLAARGIRLRGTVERCGPCPVCGGKDRFGVNVQKQLWHCRGCDKGGDVIALIQLIDGCDFREAVEYLTGERASSSHPIQMGSQRPICPRPTPATSTAAAALKVWRGGVDPRGTLAEIYLASRGLELGDDIAGEVLRWHPGVRAMLALFRDVRTDEPRAICRTFLDRDGRKIERKFFGSVGGCAIKLDADEEVFDGLHVGEGVETCMAGRQLGLRPTWALGSAGAVAAFPILNRIECLTLLTEHCEVNARAVERCAARWYDAGREVIINEPIFGKDLNDVLVRT